MPPRRASLLPSFPPARETPFDNPPSAGIAGALEHSLADLPPPQARPTNGWALVFVVHQAAELQLAAHLRALQACGWQTAESTPSKAHIHSDPLLWRQMGYWWVPVSQLEKWRQHPAVLVWHACS